MIHPTNASEVVEPRWLADWLISRGRSWVTTEEAADLLEIPSAHVSPTLARWRRAGHLFSPTRGAYVPIPPEYRIWGVVPAINFVDQMMHHLGHPYYLGLLSAAEFHGFAHQRPQVTQIVTPVRLRDRDIERVRLRFVTVADISTRPTATRNTPTGTVRVSTPEATLLDLVSMPRRGAGLSNLATIAGEMIEEDALDLQALAVVAEQYPAAVVQRTGFLVEYVAGVVDIDVDLGDLHALALQRSSRTRLRPSGPTGPLDERWNVIVNTPIEPDL